MDQFALFDECDRQNSVMSKTVERLIYLVIQDEFSQH